MKTIEKDLLIGIAEEMILQLRAKLNEIEDLHPSESPLSLATFRERLWHMEDLVDKIKNEVDEDRTG